MDNWGVFLVISVLVAFSISIITPIVKLTNVMAKLSASADILAEKQNDAIREHDVIHKKDEEQDERLSKHDATLELHEYRINKIEGTI